MLILYDKSSGEVLDNHGTSSLQPLGPPEPDCYVNTDRRDIARDSIGLLRFHDVEDAETVQQVLGHQHSVDVSATPPTVVIGDPHPAPAPSPDPTGLIDAADQQLGRQATRQLGAAYPDLLRALDQQQWSRARTALDDALAAGDLTDQQHQAILDLASQHNVPLAQ